MSRNCFLDFAVEHWFGCRATGPGFAGDIGAIEVWLIDWLIDAGQGEEDEEEKDNDNINDNDDIEDEYDKDI